MKLNELRRQKLDRQISWKETKHVKLYCNLLLASKDISTLPHHRQKRKKETDEDKGGGQKKKNKKI